jgi:glucan biosynthesis protein C
MAHDDRLHAMDNLRALAMLAGVLFHAALAYSPLIHPYFPTADRAQSAWVDVLAWFFHLFRMPVFFVVAGYFASRMLARRGMGGLIRDRLWRIVLPFAVFLPLITWALAASTAHAVATVRHPSPVLAWLAEIGQLADPPRLPPGTGHLWFLWYLMFFYVLLWIARTLGLGRVAPLLRAQRPWMLLTAAPLLLAVALTPVSAPHPAPEGFLPQFWALGFFGAYFAAGCLLHGHEAVLDRLGRIAPWLVLASLALHLVFLRLLAQQPPGPANPTASAAAAVVQAYISVWMTVACLVAARALLSRRRATLRYLADAAYWIYLVHLPILFVVQYRLMDLELPWWQKFAVAVGATFAASLLGYELLVRRTPLGRLVGPGGRRDDSVTPARRDAPA